MDSFYDELEKKQRNNQHRLRQFNQTHGDNRIASDTKGSTGSFSWRMVIVLLILSVTMLLKQTDCLNGNAAYTAVMAQIQDQNQEWPDQVKDKIEAILPKSVTQWLKAHE